MILVSILPHILIRSLDYIVATQLNSALQVLYLDCMATMQNSKSICLAYETPHIIFVFHYDCHEPCYGWS